MTGDQKYRHCDKCNKSVHDISQLTKEEAEQILCKTSNSICIRIQQNSNGAFKTQSGWMKRIAIAATLSLVPLTACGPESQITGEPIAPYSEPTNPETNPEIMGDIAPPKLPEQGEQTMGKVAVPELMGEVSANPTPTMGSVAPSTPTDEKQTVGRIAPINSK